MPAHPGFQAGLVRDGDRPRYYATLYAPPECREPLFSLFAFAVELARIPGLVSDPTLGELRLEWWRTSLRAAAEGADEAPGPVLQGLLSAMRKRRLPMEPIIAMIDARASDLYADPPASRGDMEGHLGETESALFQMAAMVLAGEEAAGAAEASGHSGIAYGLARNLGGLGSAAGSMRTLIPADILAARSIAPEAAATARRTPEMDAAIGDAAALGREHVRAARLALRYAPEAAVPAFLPLAVLGAAFDRIERRLAGGGGAGRLSDFETLARISWAAWRGGLAA